MQKSWRKRDENRSRSGESVSTPPQISCNFGLQPMSLQRIPNLLLKLILIFLHHEHNLIDDFETEKFDVDV